MSTTTKLYLVLQTLLLHVISVSVYVIRGDHSRVLHKMIRLSSIRLQQPFIRHVSMNRPAPLPLPRNQQREFEELLRKAQTPLAPLTLHASPSLAVHPDARKPVKPEFEGDVNPTTGETGGPKREPITHSAADPGGDWSFKGRVSDF